MKHISNEFRNEAVANREELQCIGSYGIRLKTAITTKCRNENNAAAAATSAVFACTDNAVAKLKFEYCFVMFSPPYSTRPIVLTRCR